MKKAWKIVMTVALVAMVFIANVSEASAGVQGPKTIPTSAADISFDNDPALPLKVLGCTNKTDNTVTVETTGGCTFDPLPVLGQRDAATGGACTSSAVTEVSASNAPVECTYTESAFTSL